MGTLVATGQITILDSNDTLSTGSTPPSNPVAGITLWVDTSVFPNLLRKWNGTSWEIVNDAQSGRNRLVLTRLSNTITSMATGGATTDNATLGTSGTPLPFFSNYVTISRLSGAHNISVSFFNISNVFLGSTYLSNGNQYTSSFPVTYSVPKGTSGIHINVKRTDGAVFTITEVSNIKIKVEPGYTATAYTPAPEDLNGIVSSLSTSITAQANEIALKATKTEVNVISGDVTQAKADIITNANAITSKVSQTSFDALKTNSRNYLRNSAFLEALNATYCAASGGVTISIDSATKKIAKCNSLKVIQTTATTTGANANRVLLYPVDSKVCNPASFSMYVYSTISTTIYFRIGSNDTQSTAIVSGWNFIKKEGYTSTVGASVVFGFTTTGTYYITCPVLTESTKAQDWQPSPEDSLTAGEMATIYTTREQTSAEIQDSIFTSDELVARINLSSEGVKIIADSIDLSGATTEKTTFGVDGKIVANDIFAKGHIEGDSGNFGDWKLSGRQLLGIAENGDGTKVESTKITTDYMPRFLAVTDYWKERLTFGYAAQNISSATTINIIFPKFRIVGAGTGKKLWAVGSLTNTFTQTYTEMQESTTTGTDGLPIMEEVTLTGPFTLPFSATTITTKTIGGIATKVVEGTIVNKSQTICTYYYQIKLYKDGSTTPYTNDTKLFPIVNGTMWTGITEDGEYEAVMTLVVTPTYTSTTGHAIKVDMDTSNKAQTTLYGFLEYGSDHYRNLIARNGFRSYNGDASQVYYSSQDGFIVRHGGSTYRCNSAGSLLMCGNYGWLVSSTGIKWSKNANSGTPTWTLLYS